MHTHTVHRHKHSTLELPVIQFEVQVHLSGCPEHRVDNDWWNAGISCSNRPVAIWWRTQAAPWNPWEVFQ